MIETYQIKKPTSDLNPIILGVKYLTLIIVFFVAGWFIIPIYLSLNPPHKLNSRFELLFADPVTSSIIILILVLSWLGYQTWKKFNYGEVFKIEFLENEQKLKVYSVNEINDSEKAREYNFSTLTYELIEVEDALFGKQRVLKIYDAAKKVHQINIDRSGWCRNERIENLIARIKTGHSNI